MFDIQRQWKQYLKLDNKTTVKFPQKTHKQTNKQTRMAS